MNEVSGSFWDAMEMNVYSHGSTFPGAQGHMPLDFAVGP